MMQPTRFVFCLLTCLGLLLSNDVVSATSKPTSACRTPSPWITLEASICYGSKEDSFTKFTVDRNSTLVAIRLVHLSGQLLCYSSSKASASFWGCSSSSMPRCSSAPCMSTLVTNSRNEIVLPAGKTVDATGFYDLNGFEHRDDVIILKPVTLWAMQVYAGQEFRVWYGPDLKDSNSEHFGSGTHCVQVDISYYE